MEEFWHHPGKEPCPLISGGIKAAIVQFQIPALLLLGAVLMYVNGPWMMAQILITFFNLSFLTVIISLVNKTTLPWSLPTGNKNQGNTVLTTIFLMIALSVVGLLHAFAFPYWWASITIGLLSATGTWFGFRELQKTSWDRVRKFQE